MLISDRFFRCEDSVFSDVPFLKSLEDDDLCDRCWVMGMRIAKVACLHCSRCHEYGHFSDYCPKKIKSAPDGKELINFGRYKGPVKYIFLRSL